jgi:hypothetical protein
VTLLDILVRNCEIEFDGFLTIRRNAPTEMTEVGKVALHHWIASFGQGSQYLVECGRIVTVLDILNRFKYFRSVKVCHFDPF